MTPEQGNEILVNLYDPIPGHIGLSLETIQRMYDGTAFRGANGLQVVLNNEGELIRVNSFDLGHRMQMPPFVKIKGGWKGEFGFYGESTVLGIRLNSVVTTVKENWIAFKNEQDPIRARLSFREWKRNKTVLNQTLARGEQPEFNPQVLMSQRGSIVESNSDFPIQPHDIDILKHLFDAYGNSETEDSAHFVIKLCQQKNSWNPFTTQEVSEVYRESGLRDGFNYKQLMVPGIGFSIVEGDYQIGGGWLVLKEGKVFVTSAFIEAAYKSSPAK